MITQVQQAQLIARVVRMSEELAEILDILLPDGETECPHPPEVIEHEETMDDEKTPYRCKACGKVQDTPFHSEV